MLFAYSLVAVLGLIALTALVLWRADRMGLTSVRITASVVKLVTLEVELGGTRRVARPRAGAPSSAEIATVETIPRRRGR